jgi:hypothetical protein
MATIVKVTPLCDFKEYGDGIPVLPPFDGYALYPDADLRPLELKSGMDSLPAAMVASILEVYRLNGQVELFVKVWLEEYPRYVETMQIHEYLFKKVKDYMNNDLRLWEFLPENDDWVVDSEAPECVNKVLSSMEAGEAYEGGSLEALGILANQWWVAKTGEALPLRTINIFRKFVTGMTSPAEYFVVEKGRAFLLSNQFEVLNKKGRKTLLSLEVSDAADSVHQVCYLRFADGFLVEGMIMKSSSAAAVLLSQSRKEEGGKGKLEVSGDEEENKVVRRLRKNSEAEKGKGKLEVSEDEEENKVVRRLRKNSMAVKRKRKFQSKTKLTSPEPGGEEEKQVVRRPRKLPKQPGVSVGSVWKLDGVPFTEAGSSKRVAALAAEKESPTADAVDALETTGTCRFKPGSPWL